MVPYMSHRPCEMVAEFLPNNVSRVEVAEMSGTTQSGAITITPTLLILLLYVV